MDKNLRWRAIAILAVVAISIWGFYPPTEKVKLGLDLKGGVHLVLRVQTDDALRLDTETTMEQLREAVEAKGLVNVTFTGVDPTRFRVDAVPQEQDAAFREAAGEVETRFNRESGTAGSYSFVMKPNMAVQLREDAVEQALQTIERRVNELGVAEPVVARTGAAGDHILVQLPGVENPQRAKDIIRSTALLELKIVEDGPASTREQLLQTRGGVVPGNMEILPGVSDTAAPGDRAETVYYLVRKVAVVTGRDLRNAKPSLDEMNRPAVSFSLNTDGARKFGKATGENVGRRLAIILDGRVQSAPGHREPHLRRGAHLGHLHPAGGPGPVPRAAVGRPAGVADLSRRADRRAEPRGRVDPVGRDGGPRRAAAGRGLPAVLLQALRAERDCGDGHQPRRAARP